MDIKTYLKEVKWIDSIYPKYSTVCMCSQWITYDSYDSYDQALTETLENQDLVWKSVFAYNWLYIINWLEWEWAQRTVR